MSEARLRPAVLWFAQQMERRLRENDHKSGWSGVFDEWLMDRLREEVAELEGCTSAEVVNEAADVANFAMMLADNSIDGPRLGNTRALEARAVRASRKNRQGRANDQAGNR